jgi:hypothetical protein
VPSERRERVVGLIADRLAETREVADVVAEERDDLEGWQPGGRRAPRDRFDSVRFVTTTTFPPSVRTRSRNAAAPGSAVASRRDVHARQLTGSNGRPFCARSIW